MVARWIANLILVLMLIGLALGIRYELMVTEWGRAHTAYPANSGDTEANWRRVELEPSPTDREPAPSPASSAVGPIPESVESPPVVRLSPDGDQPTMGQAQDQAAADAASEGGAGTRHLKAAPQGFGVDPFAPDEPDPQGARSKSGGVPAPRSK